MPNIKSAIKQARQNKRRRLHNTSRRAMLRTHIKRVIKAIEGGNHTSAMSEFKNAQPLIDRMVNKGFIHKNSAARYKRRLNAKIKKLAA